MNILIDTLGSERGVAVAVEAGIRIQQEWGSSVIFVGPESDIRDICHRLGTDHDTGRVIDTREVIRMDEHAVEAVGRKTDASIVLAVEAIRDGRGDALISPGHTGATVVAARDILGLLPGVVRPGLSQILPARAGKRFMLVDAGATVTVTADDLALFGVMGRTAASILLGLPSPSVGLLNIGAEPGKGNRTLIDAYERLARLGSSFIGNVEGHAMWQPAADVVVTDGITGNIVIKSAEGLLDAVAAGIFRGTGGSPHEPLARHFSRETYGGAMLLGVRGIIGVCHGRASVEEMVRVAESVIRCTGCDGVGRMERGIRQALTSTTNEEMGR
ncbi:hypothetical protein JXA80_13135 [bacterium]|nr:hypothetical protein [candidate division CSSED10-310 bacterium]